MLQRHKISFAFCSETFYMCTSHKAEMALVALVPRAKNPNGASSSQDGKNVQVYPSIHWFDIYGFSYPQIAWIL